MPKNIGVSCLLLCFLMVVSGCSQQAGQSPVSNGESSPTGSINTPAYEPTETVRPTETTIPEIQFTATPTDQSQKADWVLSSEAKDFLGQVKTVRVETSHCSYKAGINGSPTFCNDQPYPDHAFTYLIWGLDLSHYDQECILVTGEISAYDGKPQIVVDEVTQMEFCDS